MVSLSSLSIFHHLNTLLYYSFPQSLNPRIVKGRCSVLKLANNYKTYDTYDLGLGLFLPWPWLWSFQAWTVYWGQFLRLYQNFVSFDSHFTSSLCLVPSLGVFILLFFISASYTFLLYQNICTHTQGILTEIIITSLSTYLYLNLFMTLLWFLLIFKLWIWATYSGTH